jgi:hypothetical protein
MLRTISGYHILMSLTIADSLDDISEDISLRKWLMEEMPAVITTQDQIIRDWLVSQFVMVNLDKEMEKIKELSADNFTRHFQENMDIFYQNSTEKERLSLLQFAIHLIQADGIVTKEENILFDMLYDAWADDTNQ